MTARALLLAICLAAPAAALDWDKVPNLPHKVVADWARLPAGWNFGETTGVAVDAQDNVWVFNRGAHPVMQFDKTGQLVRAWTETPVKSAHGVGVGPDGGVWLIDVEGHSVMKFTPDGRLRMVITNAGRREGDNDTPYTFNRPTGIAFKPNGDFYVSDGYVNSRVAHYSRDGKFLRQWGRKGTANGEFDLVHDVAVDKAGRVYVADRSNSRVQVFDADGKFIDKWTDVGQPWGLAYSERDNTLYMADGLNNRIVHLNTDGKVMGKVGEFGKAQGQLDFAHHLAVDSEGSVYVAEIKNWRVQKFAK